MVEISLSDTGGAWYNYQTVQTLGDATPMFVTECFRCLGIIMIWQRKGTTTGFVPQYAATG